MVQTNQLLEKVNKSYINDRNVKTIKATTYNIQHSKSKERLSN